MINRECIGAQIFIEGQDYFLTEFTAMRIMTIMIVMIVRGESGSDSDGDVCTFQSLIADLDQKS